jgi:putative selenate reductase
MAELVPIPFTDLLRRIYYERERCNSIFDLPERKFWKPAPGLDLSVSFCGNRAANPVGPAAGPHTQLAQNLILSWLAGSRILELKTVQINDRLQLTRPCIDMATVGYNTEWSQELKLDESQREYVKASIIIEMLREWVYPGEAKRHATIFDVSVGYDLAGIQTPQIRAWLTSMRDASALVEEFRAQIPDEFAAYRGLPFKTEISNSITLSTFHGTPADEIEHICEFLLTEMDYHVIIKMNPPMLGRPKLEYLLYERLGYTGIEVNEKVYDVNISFNDAVAVVQRLQDVAATRDKTVGVKFGNTLEVKNNGSFLKDKVEYLSGQPLHILHLALVDEWRRVFGAEFPVSFSAGVDANNFSGCAAIGLVPITTCTDLLRPGGYGRLPQYLINLERAMNALGATTMEQFILLSAGSVTANRSEAILQNTASLLESSIANPRYHQAENQKPPRKIGSHLELWDCINCDKCIPVCPNDANFFFELTPVDIEYKNIEITGRSFREIDGGRFVIGERHQIATFADACNECGNCDVFCPEDGGPYIEKPRFFGSIESYRRWNAICGFFLARENGSPALYGRFHDREFILHWNRSLREIRFQHNECVIHFDDTTDEVLSVDSGDSQAGIFIDKRFYFAMKALTSGMLDANRVHFVNVGAGFINATDQQHA